MEVGVVSRVMEVVVAVAVVKVMITLSKAVR